MQSLPVEKVVKFLFQSQTANSVSVIGDFNNWRTKEGLMKKNGNMFDFELKLGEGEYLYQFAVDDSVKGKYLTPDGLNQNFITSIDNKKYSKIIVRGENSEPAIENEYPEPEYSDKIFLSQDSTKN